MSTWRRECACGSVVTADPLDPAPMVQAHVFSQPHRAWSDRHSWFPRTTDPDPTAAGTFVDVSECHVVRPVRVRRPGVRVRRYTPGRNVA